MRSLILSSIVLLLMSVNAMATQPVVTSNAFYAGGSAEAATPPATQPMGPGAFFSGEIVEVSEFDAVPTIPEADPWESAFKNYAAPPTQDGDVVCLDCEGTVSLMTDDFCTTCELVNLAPSTMGTTTVTTTTMTSQEGGEMSSGGSGASFGNHGGPIRNIFGNAKARRENRRARRQSRGGLFRSCSSSSYQLPMSVSYSSMMSC